ncbi:hypothetical protein [Agaribacter marinus]|uniref:Uncharacterized protein n=1 Tax=Agaribacter marinus TaxID=1431249 RepID=A0AA37SUL6_9ALTE|nr:hypothetical protein [Agaribacter marinus]GLR69402.1 hypothetical protein GCM10007852_03100 [Agaribacter marinus]
MPKLRVVKLLSLAQLEQLNTQRVLAYLDKLNRCEDSLSKSDLDEENIEQVHGIIFKDSEEWQAQYRLVKSVLENRPNI